MAAAGPEHVAARQRAAVISGGTSVLRSFRPSFYIDAFGHRVLPEPRVAGRGQPNAPAAPRPPAAQPPAQNAARVRPVGVCNACAALVTICAYLAIVHAAIFVARTNLFLSSLDAEGIARASENVLPRDWELNVSRGRARLRVRAAYGVDGGAGGDGEDGLSALIRLYEDGDGNAAPDQALQHASGQGMLRLPLPPAWQQAFEEALPHPLPSAEPLLPSLPLPPLEYTVGERVQVRADAPIDRWLWQRARWRNATVLEMFPARRLKQFRYLVRLHADADAGADVGGAGEGTTSRGKGAHLGFMSALGLDALGLDAAGLSAGGFAGDSVPKSLGARDDADDEPAGKDRGKGEEEDQDAGTLKPTFQYVRMSLTVPNRSSAGLLHVRPAFWHHAAVPSDWSQTAREAVGLEPWLRRVIPSRRSCARCLADGGNASFYCASDSACYKWGEAPKSSPCWGVGRNAARAPGAPNESPELDGTDGKARGQDRHEHEGEADGAGENGARERPTWHAGFRANCVGSHEQCAFASCAEGGLPQNCTVCNRERRPWESRTCGAAKQRHDQCAFDEFCSSDGECSPCASCTAHARSSTDECPCGPTAAPDFVQQHKLVIPTVTVQELPPIEGDNPGPAEVAGLRVNDTVLRVGDVHVGMLGRASMAVPNDGMGWTNESAASVMELFRNAPAPVTIEVLRYTRSARPAQQTPGASGGSAPSKASAHAKPAATQQPDTTAQQPERPCDTDHGPFPCDIFVRPERLRRPPSLLINASLIELDISDCVRRAGVNARRRMSAEIAAFFADSSTLGVVPLPPGLASEVLPSREQGKSQLSAGARAVPGVVGTQLRYRCVLHPDLPRNRTLRRGCTSTACSRSKDEPSCVVQTARAPGRKANDEGAASDVNANRPQCCEWREETVEEAEADALMQQPGLTLRRILAAQRLCRGLAGDTGATHNVTTGAGAQSNDGASIDADMGTGDVPASSGGTCRPGDRTCAALTSAILSRPTPAPLSAVASRTMHQRPRAVAVVNPFEAHQLQGYSPHYAGFWGWRPTAGEPSARLRMPHTVGGLRRLRALWTGAALACDVDIHTGVTKLLSTTPSRPRKRLVRDGDEPSTVALLTVVERIDVLTGGLFAMLRNAWDILDEVLDDAGSVAATSRRNARPTLQMPSLTCSRDTARHRSRELLRAIGAMPPETQKSSANDTHARQEHEGKPFWHYPWEGESPWFDPQWRTTEPEWYSSCFLSIPGLLCELLIYFGVLEPRRWGVFLRLYQCFSTFFLVLMLFVLAQGDARQHWALGFVTAPITLLHQVLHGFRGAWARVVHFTGACIYALIVMPLSSMQLNSPLNAFACVTVHLFSNLLTPLRRPEVWAFSSNRNKLGNLLRAGRVLLHAHVARWILARAPLAFVAWSLSWYGALFELLNDYLPVLLVWYAPIAYMVSGLLRHIDTPAAPFYVVTAISIHLHAANVVLTESLRLVHTTAGATGYNILPPWLALPDGVMQLWLDEDGHGGMALRGAFATQVVATTAVVLWLRRRAASALGDEGARGAARRRLRMAIAAEKRELERKCERRNLRTHAREQRAERATALRARVEAELSEARSVAHAEAQGTESLAMALEEAEQRSVAKLKELDQEESSDLESSDDEGAVPTCRICFEEASAELGPLVSPCLCRGSVRWVHASCLSTWRYQSVNPASRWECDSCRFRYVFRRTLRATLLRSAFTLHIVALFGLVGWSFICGYIAKAVDATVLNGAFDMGARELLDSDLALLVLGEDTVVNAAVRHAWWVADYAHFFSGCAFIGLVNFLSLGMFGPFFWNGGGGGRRGGGGPSLMMIAVMIGMVRAFLVVLARVTKFTGRHWNSGNEVIVNVEDALGNLDEADADESEERANAANADASDAGPDPQAAAGAVAAAAAGEQVNIPAGFAPPQLPPPQWPPPDEEAAAVNGNGANGAGDDGPGAVAGAGADLAANNGGAGVAGAGGDVGGADDAGAAGAAADAAVIGARGGAAAEQDGAERLRRDEELARRLQQEELEAVRLPWGMRWLAGAAVGAGAGGNANRNAVEANGANGNGRPAVVADEQQNRNRGFVLGPFQAFGLGLALIVILTVIDILELDAPIFAAIRRRVRA